MIGLNVVASLKGTPKGRPEFSNFPYTAPSVLKNQKKITFNSYEDFKSYLILVYNESLDFNKGDTFGSIIDTFSQRPFFCDPKIILNTKFQDDIRRYIYCEQTNTPPYAGGYGDTPYIWIEKNTIIRNVVNSNSTRELKHGKPKTNN